MRVIPPYTHTTRLIEMKPGRMVTYLHRVEAGHVPPGAASFRATLAAVVGDAAGLRRVGRHQATRDLVQIGVGQLDQPGRVRRDLGALLGAEGAAVLGILPGTDDIKRGHGDLLLWLSCGDATRRGGGSLAAVEARRRVGV
jgi:hypothetical protein